MKTYNYTIKDTKKGIFANVELLEGNFNLEIKQLPYDKINGNRRIFEIVGYYPTEKYSISYEAGKLFILEINASNYVEGQKVNHVIFGEGTIIKVTENVLLVDFNGNEKTIMKSIATNFLK